MDLRHLTGVFSLLIIAGMETAAQPSFSIEPDFLEIQEDMLEGSQLFNFTLTTPGSSGTVTLTITPAELVELSHTSVSTYNQIINVKLKSMLDRESADKHSVRILAVDTPGNEVTDTVLIYVTDVNDNSPAFQNVPYFWNIPELPFDNSSKYTQIAAFDPDRGNNGTVRFSFKPNTQSTEASDDYLATFGINSTSGEISLKKALDYASNSYYQFTLFATDQGTPTHLQSNVTLVIRVQDVQNTPPFFTGIPYRYKIPEESPPKTVVTSVTARDGDTGISNQVNYTVDGGSCLDSFEINATNGQLFTKKRLDRDTGSIMNATGVCILTILATEIETGGPQFGETTSTADVTITVEDINDNFPTFENDTYFAKIQENAQRNVPLDLVDPQQIYVSDMDQGENATMDISLEWTNRSKCDDFKVSPDTVRQTGSLILQVENSNILDFEVKKSLEFLIVATERSNTSHIATASVKLNLTDENDNSPQFNELRYTFNISEEPKQGTVVGIIYANDSDSGDFGEVMYTLLGSEEKFNINNMTGEITTVCEPADLDRETIGIYYLTVTATDDLGQGRSNSTSVRINLLDINDNEPEFMRDEYREFVKENEEYQSKPVLTVVANDRDEVDTNNSHVEYFINRSSSLSILSTITINASTGELHFTSPIDYEKLQDQDTGVFTFTVYARDFGNPQLTGNATVEITVEDVNDNGPIFNQSEYHAEVQENATSAVDSLFSVVTVFASDNDGSERNNRFQYFIQDGAMNRFGIDPESGDIYVQRNAELDRETLSTYNLTVVAIDLGSDPNTGTANVIINVTDVNDEPPMFNSSTCSKKEIHENENSGKTVTICDATDHDESHDLNYSIKSIRATDENGALVNSSLVENYFLIDSTNGIITVNTKPDREVAEVIQLTLLVEDINAEINIPQNDTKTLTITLLDVNDNDPVFHPQEYNMSVSENALNPTRLDSIHATDVDKNRTITYSISPTESFRVDNASGIIYKDGQIDREKNDTILLYVTATDDGVPTRNSTTKVFIEVIDFNDNSPIFYPNSTDLIIEIYENTTVGDVVAMIMAYDIDEGLNAVINYNIDSGADGHFEIDPGNGSVMTSHELDRETLSVYNLRIIARDSPVDSVEQRTNQTTLKFIILDINDNDPQFTNEVYVTSVSEITDVATVITTITATDKDEGLNQNLTYSFLNDTSPPGLFAVKEMTGEIYVNKSLQKHVGTYLLHLRAVDGGNPPRNGTTIVNITVRDYNINPPILANLPENDTIRVFECFKIGTEIYKFNYTDGDRGENAKAYFNMTAIEDDNVLDKFTLDEHGSLKIKASLDANIAAIYRFQIQATDRGLPPLSSEKHSLYIRVIDVNNYLPGFDDDTADFTVKENEPNGTFVGTVTAVDDDKDSLTCYNISNTLHSSYFDIGLTTGQITTKRPIDREIDGDVLQIMVVTWDCTVSNYTCGNDTEPPQQNKKPNITVNIHIQDVDDNPPIFVYAEISVGMRRTEEVGFVLDLDLKTGGYVRDNDTVQFGRQAWIFSNNGTAIISSGLQSVVPGTGVNECSTGNKNLFCITGNGSIVNNKYFSEDLSGYFLVPVSVRDAAGSDQSVLKIYLISDSQVLIMTIFDTKQKVATYKDEILGLYSNITGYMFVYDGLQDHKTSTGSIDTSRSDLYFHIVDPNTQRILPSDEAQRLVDSSYDLLRAVTDHYKVLQVLASTANQELDEDDPMRTVYILTAVVVLLALTVAVIVYVSLTLRSRYKRKIKALSVDKTSFAKEESNTVVPGSNQYSKMSNPLLNARLDPVPQYDNISLSSNNSIDKNEVGTPREDTLYDELETKEKIMELFVEQDNTEHMESPLDAALRMHELNKTAIENGIDNREQLDDSDDVADQEKVIIHGYVNETFEMESSDI